MKLDVFDRTRRGEKCTPVARAILDREEEIECAKTKIENLQNSHIEEVRRLEYQVEISEEVLRALRAGENALS